MFFEITVEMDYFENNLTYGPVWLYGEKDFCKQDPTLAHI